MEASCFSIWQHLIDPCQFSLKEGENREALTFRQKIQTLALAIFAGVACVFALSQMIRNVKAIQVLSGMVGFLTFYGLTAYYKIQEMRHTQQEKDDLLSLPTRVEMPSSPPVSVKSVEVLLEQEKSKFKEVIPFFTDILQPTLKKWIAKASDANVCFVKGNTAPFSTWFQSEYKGESQQKANLFYLRKQCPEVNQGLFVSIRGDGDCTYRSIGAGVMLQSILEKPFPNIKKLSEQFHQIANKLKVQASDLAIVSKNMQNQAKHLREEAQQIEQEIQQHRFSDGYLNEKGQPMKATLDEKREVAEILEKHTQELGDAKNQKKIQELITQLEATIKHLDLLFSKFGKDPLNDQIQQEMIELLELEEFDQALICYLRNISALNLILNMEKMDLYSKHLNTEEQVILGESSVFELICQRANARQPNLSHLQGNINDALSLSMLFEQPINWYRCEVAYEADDKIIHMFGTKETNESKKHLYILNRPGHSDSIFV